MTEYQRPTFAFFDFKIEIGKAISELSYTVHMKINDRDVNCINLSNICPIYLSHSSDFYQINGLINQKDELPNSSIIDVRIIDELGRKSAPR